MQQHELGRCSTDCGLDVGLLYSIQPRWQHSLGQPQQAVVRSAHLAAGSSTCLRGQLRVLLCMQVPERAVLRGQQLRRLQVRIL